MNALPYRFSRRDRVYSLLKKVGQLESPDVLLSDHDLRASLRVFFAAKQSNGNVRILTDRPEIWRGIKGVDVKFSPPFRALGSPQDSELFAMAGHPPDAVANACSTLLTSLIMEDEETGVQYIGRHKDKGVVVYVNSQEDAEFLPKTIEGIPLAVYVTGPIVAASGKVNSRRIVFRPGATLPEGHINENGGTLTAFLSHSSVYVPLTAGHSVIMRPKLRYYRDRTASYDPSFPYEGEWDKESTISNWYTPEDSASPWAYTKKCMLSRGIDAAIGDLLLSSAPLHWKVPVFPVKDALTAAPFEESKEYVIHTPRMPVVCGVDSLPGQGQYFLWTNPDGLPVWFRGHYASLVPRSREEPLEYGDSGSLVTDLDGAPVGMLGGTNYPKEHNFEVDAHMVGACFSLAEIAGAMFNV